MSHDRFNEDFEDEEYKDNENEEDFDDEEYDEDLFDIEENYDDDDEDKELLLDIDLMARQFAKRIEKLMSEDCCINPVKQKKLFLVYRLMQELAKTTKNMNVSYMIQEPSIDTGGVIVIVPRVIFANSAAFVKAVSLCDVFEAYARTDGTIRLDFGFNDMVVRL